MILETKDKRAKQAPHAWSKQYSESDNPRQKAITKELNALTKPTADTVNNIIGNHYWTEIQCDCCGSYVDAAVHATELNGDHSLLICADCLSDANKIIGK